MGSFGTAEELANISWNLDYRLLLLLLLFYPKVNKLARDFEKK